LTLATTYEYWQIPLAYCYFLLGLRLQHAGVEEINLVRKSFYCFIARVLVNGLYFWGWRRLGKYTRSVNTVRFGLSSILAGI